MVSYKDKQSTGCSPGSQRVTVTWAIHTSLLYSPHAHIPWGLQSLVRKEVNPMAPCT